MIAVRENPVFHSTWRKLPINVVSYWITKYCGHSNICTT